MRLISLNVALFEENNPQLAAFLSEQNPDIICLQEVAEQLDLKVKPQYISKPSIDKATKNLTYSFFSPTWKIKSFRAENFHKRKVYFKDLGGFVSAGNYLKSKFKISKKQAIYTQNNAPKIIDGVNWPEKDTKIFQVIDMELPGGKKLRVINYHGIWTQDKAGHNKTLAANKQILKYAKEVPYPVITCGDFNLLPDSPSMKVFKGFKSLVDEFKIKTTRPASNELSHMERNIVDYILISKEVKVKSFTVPNLEISDHLPLILDFQL